LQISRCQHGVIAENVHDGTRRTAVRILAVSHGALVTNGLAELLGAPALTGETGIAKPQPDAPDAGAGIALANALHLPLKLDDEVLGRVVLANRSGGFSEALVDELSPVIHAITRIVADYRSVRRREAAEHASALKSAFLAHVNHELRTPLSGVIANLELLCDTGLSADQRELVNASMSAGRGLLSVIGNTLDLTKIEAEELALDPTEFDLLEVVESIRSIYHAAAKAKHLALTSTAATEIPGRVIADEMRLRQILSNLLNNAVTFTHKGQISLSVAAEKIDERSAWLHFAVEDTGIGFEPEQAEALFTPFRQASTSIARDFGGTGLGLAIARELTVLHGGEIRCSSRPHEGSRFLVSLPVTVTQWAGGAATAPRDAAPEADGDICRFPTGAAPRVLVVDDQAMNRRVLERQLERLNIDCDLADDGRQALDLLTRRRYDIVIADCAMPVMDGLEMTRQLRAAEAAAGRARTTVIALTANAITGASQDCYAAGMDAFLTKPLQLAELSDVLRQWHQNGPQAAAAAPAAPAPREATPMDRPPIDRPPIDRADLARILGDDDPAQLDRIIEAFCHSWQESLAAIEQLLERQDAAGLAEAAHAAKGIAQYGAAGRLAAAAAELEALARAENWAQAAASVRYLKSETRRLEAFLTTSGLMGHEQLKTA
ncbi:MAG: ATP-binding protein, partial [Kiloniellaceae bacterium]